ncbi:protein split ends-like isoform X3 [Macrobrachium rosenbergii]|uniref:protein split ends-like isoform X3 n=2 Tax=Macrobrachium rosenbergii TaxID=79674 RepID=UPI0034D6B59E
MYAGAETSKETHNISPHIAAHKSSLAATSAPTNLTSVVLSGSSSGPHDVVPSHITNKGLSPHIPTYRVGIHVPHHSVVKGIDSDGHLLLPRHSHGNLPSNLSKSAPQDLSAHAAGGSEKAVPLELTPHTSTHHHKPLPHIHTVVSQAMNSSHVGTVIPAHQSDRGSPYYRVQDPVISVQGQSCILVSTVGEGVSCHQPTTQTATLVHAQTSLPTQISATNLTTMPAASLAGTVTLPSHGHPLMASTIPQGHIVLTDCTSASAVGDEHASALSLEPKKEKIDNIDNMGVPVNHDSDGTQLSVGTQQSVGSQPVTAQQSISPQQHVEGQQQSSGPQRDLVRQALQAVVTHPQHKTGNDQEVIEYNYTAGDIAELLMMNIQVNASLHAINKGGPPPETGSAQVVVLQPAAVDDTSELQCPVGTPKQRRRPKLSEEAQVERRNKIASRMREKRAGENDEQKRLRRLREAERMRRKRATESEESKLRRRLEAAARARHRRATMSPEERVIDRQKAAARMRLRRATESDEAKAIRRMKAAERMRKRRANETPEQRAQRRQSIALRMKTRRKQKTDTGVNGEDPDVNNMNCRLIKCENAGSVSPSTDGQDSLVNVSTGQATHLSTAQLVQPGSHVAIPSSVGVGGSIALLHVDAAIPQVAITPTSVLSTVDMAQLTQSQPLPLHKSVTTSEQQVGHL